MNTNLHTLSDSELLSNLSKLSLKEGATTLAIIVHLIEVNRRGIYRDQGYSSLWAYCVGALKYGEAAAARRATTAKCATKFPELLELIEKREVSLSTVCQIAGVLKAENKSSVIHAVKGKSTGQIRKYLDSLAPRSKVVESIKPVVKSIEKQALATAKAASELPTLFSQALTSRADSNTSVTREALPLTTNTSSAAIDSAIGVNRNKELANLKAEKEYQVTIAADEETTEILAEVQKIRGNKESLGALLKAVLKEYVDRHAPEAKEARRQKSHREKNGWLVKRMQPQKSPPQRDK